MKEKLEGIKANLQKKIKSANTVLELEEIRKELTGKKSDLSEISKTMGSLSNEEKKEVGMLITEIRNLIMDELSKKEDEIIAQMSVLNDPIDLTLPGKMVNE